MSGRQLAVIGGLVALMLAAWLVLRTGEPGGGDAEGLDLAAMIGPDVQYVRITRPGDEEPVELQAETRGWTVNGYPALDSLVRRALAALDTLPPARLVSRSAANHARLGLVEDSTTLVSVGPAGDPDAEFLVGEEGSDGRFVRLPGSEASYVLPEDAVGPLTRPGEEWRDYTIVRVDTAALSRIVIRREGVPPAELARAPAPDGAGAAGEPGAAEEAGAAGGAGWTIDGAPADTAVVRVYLNLLADLRATGFPADSFVFAADFENPAATVDLFMEIDPAAVGEGAAGGLGGSGSGVPDVSLLFSTGLDHPDVLVRRADYPIVYALDRQRANVLTTTGERFRRR